MKYTILFSFILSSCFVLSAIQPMSMVTGKVIRYDKKTVTISQKYRDKERKIVVKKEDIPSHFKIQAGECVSANLQVTTVQSEEISAIKSAFKELHSKKKQRSE